MKTDFSTDISHFDKILAETGEEKEFIEHCLSLANRFTLEDSAEMWERLSGISINVDSSSPTSPEEEDMIILAEQASRDIAKRCFGVEVRKRLPIEKYYFFDGNIFDDPYGKGIISYYSVFPGMVYLSRRKGEMVTQLEVFRQIWNISSYSWISYDGEDFPSRLGLACNVPSEDNLYFSQINDALNSYATFLFYHDYSGSNPYLTKDSPDQVASRHIFQPFHYQIIGELFPEIAKKSGYSDPLDIVKKFSLAKLDGDFFYIRDCCRTAFGPKGLKKLGRMTSLKEQ